MSSESIQVYLRFRPLNDQEIIENEISVWLLTKNSVSLKKEFIDSLIDEKNNYSNFNLCFNYNHVFSWDDDNQKVYETIAQKTVLSSLEGYNATILAYGQTGSGKTYTLIGKTTGTENTSFISNKIRGRPIKNPNSHCKSISSRCRSTSLFGQKFEKFEKPKKNSSNAGIISLSFIDIFKTASNDRNKHFFFKCSMMKVHNECIYDLLKDPDDLGNMILTVGETVDKEFYVKGLSEHIVNNAEEALEMLIRGEQCKNYPANDCNSHIIFRLYIRSLQVIPKNNNHPKKGKDFDFDCDETFENITTESIINFIELADSEKLNTISPDGQDLKEIIFSSLHERTKSESISSIKFNQYANIFIDPTESKVISSKTDINLSNKISNLNKILKSSLNINSKTCIICTATPTLNKLNPTLETLRFGNLARSLKYNIKPNIKRKTSSQILLGYQQDLAYLKKELSKAKESGWEFYNQNSIAKTQLENKLTKLTNMYNNMNIHGTIIVKEDIESTYTILSSQIAGDLMIICKEINEFNENSLSKAMIKFDNSGIIGQLRLGMMRNENRKIIEKINTGNKSLSVLKASKMSFVNDLEKCSVIYDKVLMETSIIKENIGCSLNTINELKKKVLVYEEGIGLENLSDFQLDSLEKMFLQRLENFKGVKVKKRFKERVAEFEEKLGKKLPVSVVDDILNKYNLD
ncbi:hypothetical protein SteCoe_9689 [Stentor coeruleus]|uniref:Kinesin motor domain-containing protein n=1 Tax=Stentor coeruleus TaxID=5963 RepID=A0A1R2CHA5_9CILI|nr:hypothetical protein SteCoe_9689 [Stentor coeruleus]